MARIIVKRDQMLVASSPSVAGSGGINGDGVFFEDNFTGSAENPLVGDGGYIQPGPGSYWNPMQRGGGLAYGTAAATDFNDCVAFRQGWNRTGHYAEGLMEWDPGYPSSSDTHEMQLMVGGWYDEDNDLCWGYEAIFGCPNSFQFVRWNGPEGDVEFGLSGTNHNGGFGAWSRGTVMRWEYRVVSGNAEIRGYQDGTLKFSATDNTAGKIIQGTGIFIETQPGFMAFLRPGTGSGNWNKYCWDRFRCGNTS